MGISPPFKKTKIIPPKNERRGEGVKGFTLPPPFPEQWGLNSVSAKFCSGLSQILISVIIQKFDVTFGDKKAGAGYWSAGNSIKLEGNWQWADKNDTGKMTFIKLVSC